MLTSLNLQVASTLKSVLKPDEMDYIEAKVSYSQGSRSRGVPKEVLSKLWSEPKHLAES